MATSASLVVRISADINDFSKQLRQLTKDVDSAAKKVAAAGKTLSVSLTLPIVAAAAAMTKLGMDQQAAAAKLQRQFGGATDEITAKLQKLHAVVPETTTALEQMANQMHQFGDGLGMSAGQANLFAGEALKMAAAIQAANPGSTMAETTDSLMRGFEGATKGLKSYGIAIDKEQVKQEAYRLGLLKVGETLTPLGTALSTYALLTDRVSKLTGEAGSVQQNASRQWQFLKRDTIDLATAIGTKLLPTFIVLVQAGEDLVRWLSSLSDGTIRNAIYVAAFAAAIGPTITLVADLTAGVVKLYEALKLLTAGGALEAIVAALSNPVVLGAIAALSLAIYGLSKAWDHFHQQAEKAAATTQGIDPLAGIKQLLALGGNAQTSTNPGDPLAQLRQSTDELTTSFERALAVGDLLDDVTGKLAGKRLEAMHLGTANTGDLKLSTGAFGIFDQLSRTLAANELGHMIAGGAPGSLIGAAASRDATAQRSPAAVRFELAQSIISDKLQLMAREMALTVDTFDAPRVAALQLAERFRQTAHDFATGFAEFKSQWSSAGNIGTSAMAGLQAGVAGALGGLTPFALAAAAIGKIMQGLQPVLDNLMGPLVALGQIIGEILVPVLRPLFQELKVFGIAVALIGEVVYTVAGGIAKAIGGLISSIGAFIRKIPFLGGIGKDIQNFGNSISNIGTSALQTAKELDQSRIQLQNLNFDDAANGLNSVAGAAQSAAEQLTNLPQAFKVNLERYYAQNAINGGPVTNGPSGYGGSGGGASGGGSSGGGGGGSGGGSEGGNGEIMTPNANVVIDGRALAQIVWNRIDSSAKRQFGPSPDRFAKLVTIF